MILFGLIALLLFEIVLPASPGDTHVIPGWHLQSAHGVSKDIARLSLPGADVSSWYRVSPRTTVFAGLLENGVYNETTIFYSDNLQAVDQSVFQTAWLYREEFKFQRPSSDEHVFLITHGITSKADIFFNGVQIASQSFQHGSYGGRRYEITEFIRQGSNALLVKAYPTNYLRDFALGFVDWNPYPPDNGTGVWRDVEVKRTGPISMSPTRVRTDFSDRKTQQTAIVTVLTDLENHTNLTIEGILQGRIQSDDSSQTVDLFEPFRIAAHGMKTVSIKAKIVNPRIWWPAAWGKQPLYSVALNVSLGRDGVSDIGAKQHFGIRKVTSELNPYNDIVFSINGYRFLVKGAGYSPDMFLRFDQGRVEKIFQYMLDMGLNTVRLEGKQEHPELYDLADRMGLMVLAGWECCDKWEGWEVCRLRLDYHPY